MNYTKTFAAFVLAAIGLGATGCVSEGYSTGYTSGYVTTPVVTPTYTEGYTAGYYAPFAVETTIIDVSPPPPRHVGWHYGRHGHPHATRHVPPGRPPAGHRGMAPAKPRPAAVRPTPPKGMAKPKPVAVRPTPPKARPTAPRKGGRPSGGPSGRRKR